MTYNVNDFDGVEVFGIKVLTLGACGFSSGDIQLRFINMMKAERKKKNDKSNLARMDNSSKRR